MKKLAQQELVQISGGAIYSCTKIEGNKIRIFLFIADAPQLNGWLVAGGLTGHITCTQVG